MLNYFEKETELRKVIGNISYGVNKVVNVGLITMHSDLPFED